VTSFCSLVADSHPPEASHLALDVVLGDLGPGTERALGLGGHADPPPKDRKGGPEE
jgi:hypothetical protein